MSGVLSQRENLNVVSATVRCATQGGDESRGADIKDMKDAR